MVLAMLVSDIFAPSIAGFIAPTIDIALSFDRESVPLECISREPISDAIDAIDDSDMVAMDDESDLAELRTAAMLKPTPPPISNNTAATFFQLIFIFLTLYSDFGFCFAAHKCPRDTS